MRPQAEVMDLGGLMGALGADLIRSITDERLLRAPVSVTVIHDPADEMPDAPGGILLLVGLRADDDRAITAVNQAPAHGFSAVALKLRGVSAQPLADAGDRRGCAVLAVDEAVPWRQLDSLITVASGGKSPAEGGDSGHDLFMLADAIAAAVDGPVAIEDLDRNVLAYSNLARHTVDPLRRNGILARRVPDMAKNRRQYRMVMQADGVVHFPFDPSDGEHARCAVAVRAGQRAVGTIWVIEQEHRVGPDGEATLREAGQLAAVHILHLQSAVDVDRQVRSEWLRALLEGHRSAPVAAARFGVVPTLPSVLVGFLLHGGDMGTRPLTRQLAAAVEQYCSAFRTTVPCVSVGQIVYVLFPSIRDPQMPRRLAKGAAAAIEARLDHRVLAAISSEAIGADQVVTLRREIDDVLDILAGRPELPTVASSRDVHAQLLLRRLVADVLDQSNRHPGVQTLLEHDAAHNTTYRETLAAYFAALGDVGKAAHALKVHPNTVRYRVRRSEELFGLRLDDPDDTLVAWLTLRLSSA